jgi:hypothetical protein
MGGVEVGGHKMINMTIRELYYTLPDFSKTGISFHNINFFRKEQRSCDGEGQKIYSLGCNIAQLGCSVTQKGAV